MGTSQAWFPSTFPEGNPNWWFRRVSLDVPDFGRTTLFVNLVKAIERGALREFLPERPGPLPAGASIRQAMAMHALLRYSSRLVDSLFRTPTRRFVVVMDRDCDAAAASRRRLSQHTKSVRPISWDNAIAAASCSASAARSG